MTTAATSPQRSSLKRSSLFADRRSLRWSVVIHTALVVAWGLGVILPELLKRLPETMEVPVVVLDAPKVAPLPLEAAPRKPQAPQKRSVFGLSRKALTTESAEAPVAKAGNTLAKEPDKETLKDEDADSLPIPTDDYLVSQMPVLLSDFRVPYPAEAKKAGIQGAVVLDLLIDEEGRVRQALIAKPLFPALDEAALQAALKLRFKPARVADKSVAVRIRYAYRFVLE